VGTIAFATDNAAAKDRLRSVSRSVTGVDLLFIGGDEGSIKNVLNVHDVLVLCVEPMLFDRWLTLRKLLKEHSPATRQPRLVLLCDELDAWFVYRVMAHGISDVIDLRLPGRELEAAIRLVVEGRDRACTDHLIAEVDIVPVVSDVGIVYADDMDRRIVALVAAGYTDREISHVVNYSYQSVRNRISRILLNSGIRNRTQLAVQHIFERLEEQAAGGGLGVLHCHLMQGAGTAP